MTFLCVMLPDRTGAIHLTVLFILLWLRHPAVLTASCPYLRKPIVLCGSTAACTFIYAVPGSTFLQFLCTFFALSSRNSGKELSHLYA
jgi:hypothetical protein